MFTVIHATTKVGNLCVGQCWLTTAIGAALLCQSDTRTLAFTNQRVPEFREAPFPDNIKFAIGESSPVNIKHSFANSMRTPRWVGA